MWYGAVHFGAFLYANRRVAVAYHDAHRLLQLGNVFGSQAAGWGEGPKKVGGLVDDRLPARCGVAFFEGAGEVGHFCLYLLGVEECCFPPGGLFIPVELRAEGGNAAHEIWV